MVSGRRAAGATFPATAGRGLRRAGVHCVQPVRPMKAADRIARRFTLQSVHHAQNADCAVSLWRGEFKRLVMAIS